MYKLPNSNYNLHQSSYVQPNWSNEFKNEKINSISANAITPWLDASTLFNFKGSFILMMHHDAEAQAQTQIVAPSQYDGTINYFSAKISRDLFFGKFA
jgi:hypothetical protein